MNNLSLHIEYLLRYHDCVILPGVGAFMKSYRDAVFESDGTIAPPVSELTFNASIQTNDGLLAHSIMRRNNVTFEEAKSKVSEGVEQIRNLLKSDREYTLGRIGVLSLGNEDNILFSPFSSPLPKVFQPIERFVRTNAETTHKNIHTEEKASSRFDTKRNYYIPINKRFVRVAAALVFVVAAASTFVVPSLHNSNYSRFQRASVMPVEWSTSSEVAEEESFHESDTNSVPTSEPSSPVTDSISTSPENFYLVVATFKTPEECRRFIDAQPAEMTFELRIVSGKKVCRVYAASSASRESLLDTMRDDTFRKLFPTAWIWES